MALDLSRVFAYLSAHGSVKVRKNGDLSTTVLRGMEKAVPLDAGAGFRLPDPHGLFYELLRQAGAVRIEAGTATVDPAAMTRLIDESGPWQAHRSARGLAGDPRLVRRLWDPRWQGTRELRGEHME